MKGSYEGELCGGSYVWELWGRDVMRGSYEGKL